MAKKKRMYTKRNEKGILMFHYKKLCKRSKHKKWGTKSCKGNRKNLQNDRSKSLLISNYFKCNLLNVNRLNSPVKPKIGRMGKKHNPTLRYLQEAHFISFYFFKILLEKNFILEELTTSGDKIPKSNCMKIDITISFTIGEKKICSIE